MKLKNFVKSHVKQSVSTALFCKTAGLIFYKNRGSFPLLKLPRAVKNLV